MRDVRERFKSIKQLKQETKDISNLSEDEKKVYWRSKELVVNLDKSIIDTINGLRKTNIINDHFRAGLCALSSQDSMMSKTYMFIGIYGGESKLNKQRVVILKNVFCGEMYVADHCFMIIQKKDTIPTDIKEGDIVIFDAIVYDYTSGGKINYGLVYIRNMEKYSTYKLPTNEVKIQNIDKNIDKFADIKMCNKAQNLVRFYTQELGLPTRFIETFVISVLTGKQKEYDLMTNVPITDIFGGMKEESFHYVLFKGLILSLYMICEFEQINFILFQKLLIELFFEEVGNGSDKYNYTISIEINLSNFDEVICFTLLPEINKKLPLEFKSYNYKITKDFYKNIIVNKH